MNPVAKKSLMPTAISTIIAVPNPPPLLTPKRQLPKKTSVPQQPTHTEGIIQQIVEPTTSQCKSI